MKAAGRALSRADNSFVPIPLSKEQHIPKPEKNGQANGDQGISRRKVPQPVGSFHGARIGRESIM
jgi:hypothetical protein